ncbi:glycosyltransferase family 4 protein [Halalkalicoccus salilacus]|uniref:glycosyltransferase family 4 protein n=1 Tax=Halalkalicoccus TaxID=332246 RepID=UPI002F96B1D3
MRILRIAQKIYPESKGGGAYHVHAMSRDQATMGHEVTVVTVDTSSEEPHLEKRDGYTLIRYPSIIKLLGNDISVGVGQYLLDAEKFDIVHAHSHLYFSTNLAALKRQFSNIPLAITNHGLYSQTAPEWVFEGYLRTIGRWTFNQADVVLCYTEEEKQRVQKFGVNGDIKVVSNGIDTERFTPEGPKSELIDHEGPAVLFVGRLVEGKRPADAIAAIEQVRKEYPEVKLYLCGEGTLREDLERQVADKELEGVVRFLGQVAYDEMPALYRASDALVLPSRAEGLPRTVLEAMACNVPIVSSDLEQIVPILGGSGATVPVGNIDGFASELDNVLSSDHHKHGRTIVQQGFQWSETVKQTTTALREQVN